MKFKYAFFQDLKNPTTVGFVIDSAGQKIYQDDEKIIEFTKLSDKISINGKLYFSEDNIKIFIYKNYLMIQVPYEERDAFNRISNGLFIYQIENELENFSEEILEQIDKISKQNGRTISPKIRIKLRENLNEVSKKIREDKFSHPGTKNLLLLVTTLSGVLIGYSIAKWKGAFISGTIGFLTGYMIIKVTEKR